MIERFIDISDASARLSVNLDRLKISTENGPEFIPLSEIKALIVSNRQASFTHAVLSSLTKAGGVFICCDEKHMPVGMLLPITANSTQTERFAKQAGLGLPPRKRLWQQIVSAKVKAQGLLLKHLHGSDHKLETLSQKVRSGDSKNIEAQASRIYWPNLFKDPEFRREPSREDQNRHLNYGYAVIRAVVARSICAAGLHPSLGLHHHNRYDGYCLASDLMEPFRPIVDLCVYEMIEKHGRDMALDKEEKQELLSFLTGKFQVRGRSRTLFDLASKTASSLAGVVMGKAQKLSLPAIKYGQETKKFVKV